MPYPDVPLKHTPWQRLLGLVERGFTISHDAMWEQLARHDLKNLVKKGYTLTILDGILYEPLADEAFTFDLKRMYLCRRYTLVPPGDSSDETYHVDNIYDAQTEQTVEVRLGACTIGREAGWFCFLFPFARQLKLLQELKNQQDAAAWQKFEEDRLDYKYGGGRPAGT